MSKENIWVLGFPAVPLIGMILIRRRAGALGSSAAGFCAHVAVPRSSAAAPTATARVNDRHLPVGVHREPLLSRIPSSHALVSDSDSRSYHPVGTISFSVGTSTPGRHRVPINFDRYPCRSPTHAHPGRDHVGVAMISLWSTPLRE